MNANNYEKPQGSFSNAFEREARIVNEVKLAYPDASAWLVLSMIQVGGESIEAADIVKLFAEAKEAGRELEHCPDCGCIYCACEDDPPAEKDD